MKKLNALLDELDSDNTFGRRHSRPEDKNQTIDFYEGPNLTLWKKEDK